MSVKLREKKLANGQVSFYLDIYHNQNRWYEFLEIHINKKKPNEEDKEKKRLAAEIRSKREHELIIEDNGLIDKKKKLADFVKFFEDYIDSKTPNHQLTATLYQLRQFAGKGPLPISRITTEWMKDFEQFLLKKVSINTVLGYLKNINGALNKLVRKQVIHRNPWHAVPKHERLKKKDTIRTAWTFEQLQKLADTPCNIQPQFRQAYFFACFTGLRWSDINGLKWSNIIQKTINNMEEWFIYFEQQKTETIEYFPLSDQAVEILKARKNQGENSIHVFPLVKETDSKTFKVHGNVDYALKKWAKAAGLDWKKMKFHTGRHTYATNLLELTNGDLYTVSKLLGHKSLQTTQIYAQVRDRIKKSAVKSLPKLDFKVSNPPALK
jgi:integrase